VGPATAIALVGVKVEVPTKRLPTSARLDVQRELDRIRQSLSIIEERLAEDAGMEASGLSDDTLVDQRTVQAPRDLYLRLARAGAFDSQKHGRRIVARWGDVRRALLEVAPTTAKVKERGDNGHTLESDGLDGLRRRLGLAGKAK
jgi:hypothetical protein